MGLFAAMTIMVISTPFTSVNKYWGTSSKLDEKSKRSKIKRKIPNNKQYHAYNIISKRIVMLIGETW